MHGLLFQVIYLHRGYREIAMDGDGDERLIAAMFKRALDLAAAWWGHAEDNSFGREVNHILWKTEAEAKA